MVLTNMILSNMISTKMVFTSMVWTNIILWILVLPNMVLTKGLDNHGLDMALTWSWQGLVKQGLVKQGLVKHVVFSNMYLTWSWFNFETLYSRSWIDFQSCLEQNFSLYRWWSLVKTKVLTVLSITNLFILNSGLFWLPIKISHI